MGFHDKVSNYNELPCGSETKTFTGDGRTVKFDLGRCLLTIILLP